MKLEGIHHITAITGDAPRNVDFYARVLPRRALDLGYEFQHPEVDEALESALR